MARSFTRPASAAGTVTCTRTMASLRVHLLDAPQHPRRRVQLLDRHRDLDRQEPPRVDAHVLPPRAPALRPRRVDVHHAEPLAVVLLAEVHPLQAARVHHRRRRDEDLVLVDVPQRNIIEGRQRQRARLQRVVAPQHHRPLRAGHRAVHRHVRRHDRRHVRVERVRLGEDAPRQVLLHVARHLVDGAPLVLLPRQQRPAPYPRQRHHLQRPRARLDPVRPEPLRHRHAAHVQRREDVERRRPRRRVRDVVVARQQEDRDAAPHQRRQPPRELPLVRLRRVPALVRVPRDEHQVRPVLRRVVHHLVERAKKVQQPRRQPQVRPPVNARRKVPRQRLHVRLRSRPPVVLDAYMNISRMDNTHACSQSSYRRKPVSRAVAAVQPPIRPRCLILPLILSLSKGHLREIEGRTALILAPFALSLRYFVIPAEAGIQGWGEGGAASPYSYSSITRRSHCDSPSMSRRDSTPSFRSRCDVRSVVSRARTVLGPSSPAFCQSITA